MSNESNMAKKRWGKLANAVKVASVFKSAGQQHSVEKVQPNDKIQSAGAKKNWNKLATAVKVSGAFKSAGKESATKDDTVKKNWGRMASAVKAANLFKTAGQMHEEQAVKKNWGRMASAVKAANLFKTAGQMHEEQEGMSAEDKALSMKKKWASLSADHVTKIRRQLEFAIEKLKVKHNANLAKIKEDVATLRNKLIDLYTTTNVVCPKVRFGRTEIQMPVLTLGGMRQQQTWSPPDDMTLNDINRECQENFEMIADRAMELGINHFETARGYGSSELQYGPVIKRYSREALILQTKVKPFPTNEEFRSVLEKSFSCLQIDEKHGGGYIDLFAFHGINKDEHIDWICREGGNMEVVREYQKAGKIRFVGFSTHGMTETIVKACETGQFDYVNLHYHCIGSYTSSGSGSKHAGNLDAVEAANRHDMGVFIISPVDKGGALYEPPSYMANVCAEQGNIAPITFQDLWLWSHSSPQTIHTTVIGAARPVDFDEHVHAIKLFSRRKEISSRIMNAMNAKVTSELGADFLDTWWKDLPTPFQNKLGIGFGYIYWLWWIQKVWGFHKYAVNRYSALQTNLLTEWDDEASYEDNVAKFSWAPGVCYRPDKEDEIRAILSNHPKRGHIMEAMKQAHEWLDMGGIIARNEIPDGLDVSYWRQAYDINIWVPFPERA